MANPAPPSAAARRLAEQIAIEMTSWPGDDEIDIIAHALHNKGCIGKVCDYCEQVLRCSSSSVGTHRVARRILTLLNEGTADA